MIYELFLVMSLRSEQIAALNQLMAAIDSKAAAFKNERFDMRLPQHDAQKKLILDLISNALTLASEMNPRPAEVLDDLNRLRKQFQEMR